MTENYQKYLGEFGSVREEHLLDTDNLRGFMRDNVRDYAEPLTVHQFKGGQSNPTYLLTAKSGRYVLRRKPAGAIKSAHAIDREYRVMSALHKEGFPVPEPMAYCEDESVLGTPFYIMEYLEGRLFYDCAMPDLQSDERSAIFDAVNQTLADLHKIDLQKSDLQDYGREGNYFSRQVARWAKQYQLTRTEDIPAMDALIEWLSDSVPEQKKTTLLHGDYSFHNVIIHPTQPRVIAVLDWELSTTGDPFGDLMYHAMDWYRPAGVSGRGHLLGKDLKALGVPALDDYIRLYCDRTNTELPTNLGFYKAFNLFRTAAITQGIVYRFKNGTASSASAGDHQKRVAPLAEAALAFTKEK